jgi:hypothetical protein
MFSVEPFWYILKARQQPSTPAVEHRRSSEHAANGRLTVAGRHVENRVPRNGGHFTNIRMMAQLNPA